MYEFFLYIITGLLLLAYGGDMLVSKAISLATKLKISPLIISFIFVSLGTSAPEFVLVLQATINNQPDIAIGNIVGSNIANVLFVLGMTALIQPIIMPAQELRRDSFVLLIVSIIFVLSTQWGNDPYIGWQFSLFMVITAFLYGCYIYKSEKESDNDFERGDQENHIFMTFIFLVISIAVVVWGADWLIKGSVGVARLMGVSDAVIGLTLIAVGTSLPELVVALLAAWRGQASIVIGSILGSNVANILLILGITASVKPLSINAQIAHFDIWVMFFSTLLVLFLLNRYRNVNGYISRFSGFIFLISYVFYIIYLYIPTGFV